MREPGVDSGRPVMFEQLEPRLLLDGNVQAWQANGDLNVRGDAADNDIEITPGPFPHWYVVDSPSGTTTINGAAGPAAIMDVTDDFNLNFTRGGDNDVVLDKDTSTYLHVHDRLTYRGGSGKDYVTLNGVLVAGRTKLLTRGGDDFVTGGNNSYFYGKVTVRSGAGVDNVGFGTVTTLHRGAYINTGSGADYVALGNPVFTLGKVKIRTGSGNDLVNVMKLAYIFRQLDIGTGFGDDTVNLSEDVYFGRKVIVNTGSGADTVDISDHALFDKRLVLKTGGGDDVVTVGIAADTGEFRDKVAINTGTGDDTLSVRGVEFQDLATANGGPGIDGYNDLGGITGTLTVNNFEV